MSKLKLPVGNGSTGKEKAVKKAGGSGKPDPGIAVSTSESRYAKEEQRYRTEDAARTLARAAEIKKDKALMKDVKQHVKSIAKACE